MPPIIGKGERMLVYGLVICIDFLQLILSIFIVTEPINHVIDIGVGIALFGYALKKRLLNANKGMVLAATFFAEQIPFVNSLPFWTFDVYNLYKGVAKEAVSEENTQNMPLNKDGVRKPSGQSTPLNARGIRPPRKV